MQGLHQSDHMSTFHARRLPCHQAETVWECGYRKTCLLSLLGVIPFLPHSSRNPFLTGHIQHAALGSPASTRGPAHGLGKPGTQCSTSQTLGPALGADLSPWKPHQGCMWELGIPELLTLLTDAPWVCGQRGGPLGMHSVLVPSPPELRPSGDF